MMMYEGRGGFKISQKPLFDMFMVSYKWEIKRNNQTWGGHAWLFLLGGPPM
jgi:hypothetical protein